MVAALLKKMHHVQGSAAPLWVAVMIVQECIVLHVAVNGLRCHSLRCVGQDAWLCVAMSDVRLLLNPSEESLGSLCNLMPVNDMFTTVLLQCMIARTTHDTHKML
jgi:hypothetical protein